MNEHIHDPVSAVQSALDSMEAFPHRAMEAPSPQRPPAPPPEVPDGHDLEAELRDLVAHDEAMRYAIHADAWTVVARLHQRMGLDPSLFRSHGARTAVAIGRLLIAEMGETAGSAEDLAFAPMNEAVARAELEKTKRTATAIRAIAGLGS